MTCNARFAPFFGKDRFGSFRNHGREAKYTAAPHPELASKQQHARTLYTVHAQLRTVAGTSPHRSTQATSLPNKIKTHNVLDAIGIRPRREYLFAGGTTVSGKGGGGEAAPSKARQPAVLGLDGHVPRLCVVRTTRRENAVSQPLPSLLFSSFSR